MESDRGKQEFVVDFPLSSNRSETFIHKPTSTLDQSNSRFFLLDQPNEVQRKSYKKENRCLLPNPIIIGPKPSQDASGEILDGMVSVKLVNGDGEDLPVNKSNALACLEGSLTRSLDTQLMGSFSLKALHTSEGTSFRLLFLISYRTKDGNFEEKVYSRPFSVFSNKQNRNSKKKRIKGLIDSVGLKV